MDVYKIMNTYYNKDIDLTLDYYNKIHDSLMRETLDKIYDMYEYMKKNSISDEDLEWVLTSLPIDLMHISESLNTLRLQHSVVKLKQKELRMEIESTIVDSCVEGTPKSSIKEQVDAEMAEHKVVETTLQCLITGIEHELSFCKELIMGCKKVWDSRRNTENVNPVKEVDTDLPDYTPESL